MKRIGILTGGGDVPGLNTVIKTVVLQAEHEGYEVIGLRKGWEALVHINPDDPSTREQYVQPLNRAAVRTIDRTGGTILHSSRTRPSTVSKAAAPAFLRSRFKDDDEVLDLTDHAIRVLESLGIDILVVTGGDDTLSYGSHLDAAGFPIIGIPKTMDNDVIGTDYCIGFSTAVSNSVRAVNNFRSTIGSHERLGIVELFGRYSGATALITGYLADVDRIIISEVPYNADRIAHLMLEDKLANPSRYSLLTISEGAKEEGGEIIQTEKVIKDPYGHEKLGGVGRHLARRMEMITGHKTSTYTLAYLMRGGEPDALDKMVAKNFASAAFQLLKQGTFGRMIGIQKGQYIDVPMSIVAGGFRPIDIEKYYDMEEYRPKAIETLGLPMFLT